MKIVYETMVVATLILTAYLVISVERNFVDVRQSIINSQKLVEPLQKQLEEQQKLVALLQIELSTFHTEVNTRIEKEEKLKANIAALSGIVSKLNQAEVLKKQGEYKKAVEILKATKDPIWRAGDTFESEQTALRGLMWPIDQVMQKWNNNNGRANTAKISIAIKAILNNIKP